MSSSMARTAPAGRQRDSTATAEQIVTALGSEQFAAMRLEFQPASAA